MIYVYIESGSFLAVGLAALLVFAGTIIALIGWIPFGIGPVIYYFFLWPWLIQNTVGYYPYLNMPTTLFAIELFTMAFAILYTVASSFFIWALTR